MSRLLPRNYRPIYSAEEIQDAVSKLASDLSPWAEGVHRQTGNQPMALCILRGAFLFFADLLKALPCSVQPAFVRCQSYAAAEILRPEDGVKLSLDDLDARCRHVLVIDDICDTGRTFSLVKRRLLEAGAAEVITAALVHRAGKTSTFTPDYVCFRYQGPEWFVGYGMDDCHWRMNYPAIYVITPVGV